MNQYLDIYLQQALLLVSQRQHNTAINCNDAIKHDLPRWVEYIKYTRTVNKYSAHYTVNCDAPRIMLQHMNHVELLFISCKYGYINCVKYLVERCNISVHTRNKNGETPLMIASWYVNLDLVQYLVKQGSDINAVNECKTALIYACAHMCPLDMFQRSLIGPATLDINETHNIGYPYIFSSSKLDTVTKLVRYLVANGADVNYKCKGDNDALCNLKYRHNKTYTVLDYATRYRNKYDTIECIINAGKFADEIRNTSLIDVCKNGASYGIIKYMIKNLHININERDKHGVTALMYACMRNPVLKCIKYMLACGADPNIRDNNGRNTLMYLCNNKQELISRCLIELLVCYGADIYAQDNYGDSALTIACRCDNTIHAAVLIEHGAMKFTNNAYNKVLDGVLEPNSNKYYKIVQECVFEEYSTYYKFTGAISN